MNTRRVLHRILEAEEPALIIVHPGSLARSLSWNLQDEDAAEQIRDAILREVSWWSGPIYAILGDLQDEIPLNPAVRAIVQSVPEANIVQAGGDANQLSRAGVELARELGAGSSAVLTGIWGGEHGCVTCLADALERNGVEVSVSANVPEEPL